MRNKYLKKIICFFTIFILISSAICMYAATISVAATEQNTVGEAKNLIDGILAYKQDSAEVGSIQEWIDTELVDNAGTTAEWYILALAQSGKYNFDKYEKALLKYLEENQVYSASSRLKYALVLSAIGSKDVYISKTLEDSIGKQGIMSYVYGLHLLNNGYKSSEWNIDSIKNQLLTLQITDGGWSITGKNSDVDVTSMTIQVLAPYYNEVGIKTAIDKALVWLSSQQLEDGNYSSYGVPNTESTAQVILALSSLGIDGFNDERFIKNENTLMDGLIKYRLQNGAFGHKEDDQYHESATVQAYYSLVSYIRMKEGKSGLYILDNANNTSSTEKQETTVEPEVTTKPQEIGENTVKDIAKKQEKTSYKLWASIIVLVISVIVSIVFYAKGKRNKKNFIGIGILTLLAIIFICVTDFKTTEEYYSDDIPVKENVIGTVTLTIRCDTIKDETDSKYIPKDGIILEEMEFDIEEDDTVYDILIEATRRNEIHMENSGTGGMVYIAGINYIYEFDYGDLSGWMYFVNGEEASVGCDSYKLSDGDKIQWLYTRNLGDDLR